MQILLMAVQAGVIVWVTAYAAIDTNDPGTTMGVFVTMVFTVWFVGALLANLWDWLRFRAVKFARALPRDGKQLEAEIDGSGRNAVLPRQAPEHAGRISARK